MANGREAEPNFGRSLRRLGLGLMLLLLVACFLVWRIDNPRAERVRMAILDRVIPSTDWMMKPIARTSRMFTDFRSYQRIYDQNQELRRELQQMKAWKEAALQLEQKNAKLLDLNKVKLSPKLSYISGVVLADSGSPFRQSALINIGSTAIQDGWAVMDGLGLVGRISGVGKNSARVIFITDSNSRVPVTIKPSDQRAILHGDNSLLPPLDFLENFDQVQPGDRVVTSGDGGVMPAGLLAGQVTRGADGRLRVRLSADYRRMEFLRVIRYTPTAPIKEPGELVGPLRPIPTDQVSVVEPNGE